MQVEQNGSLTALMKPSLPLAPGMRNRRAESLAQEKGYTLQQITLAWVLHQPINLFALIGTATVSELDNSLGALDVTLSEEEIGRAHV